MSDTDIWSAVKAGDVKKLHKLLEDGKPSADIGKQIDSSQWTILHHAVMSRNLDVVKLVVEHCNPDITAQNFDGLTPLTLACEQSVAVEIIIYLLRLEMDVESVEANECITPLHYAVFQNRIDLAKELIANGVKVDDLLLRDSSSPLYIVAIVTGNGEMLKCLLDAVDVEVPFVANEGLGFTLLDVFAERASYSAEQKIVCFEIFYKLGQLNSNAGGNGLRYDVANILKPAVLSYTSTSLIPYFIATERKWETREEILSLYDRLIPDYGMLAMFVLCECGPVSSDRKELDEMLENPYLQEIIIQVADELEQMFRNTMRQDEEKIATEAKQLLEDFATFTKSIQLESIRKVMPPAVHAALLTKHLMIDKPLMSSRQDHVAYQPIIDNMVVMGGTEIVDEIVEILLFNEEQLMRPDLVYPLLKYCTTIFMCPDTLPSALKRKQLFQWFMHLFGTWKMAKDISRPLLHVFTLKRLARDVVRETLWNGMHKIARARKSATFFDRLQSIDIPNELKGYLRYSDYTSLQYFLYHMHDAINYLKESRNQAGGD
ncbi:uncharacterized protein LOC125764392 [Anopheles funestus]|uniref:uncharacterized protein LOC125764392 n=1 Tax=Anopheles funestus TaxID=62324 RepID=UPI0020C70CA8|nr:uncharacterized protein LOC125764392 [Anopheles funestus]XP_049284521.1 uncharacterized protein LOC125764392 [Anopheles funestus]